MQEWSDYLSALKEKRQTGSSTELSGRHVFCAAPYFFGVRLAKNAPPLFMCREEKNPPRRYSSLNPSQRRGRTYQFLKKLRALCEAFGHGEPRAGGTGKWRTCLLLVFAERKSITVCFTSWNLCDRAVRPPTARKQKQGYSPPESRTKPPPSPRLFGDEKRTRQRPETRHAPALRLT